MATVKKKERAAPARRIHMLPLDRLVPSTENGRRPQPKRRQVATNRCND